MQKSHLAALYLLSFLGITGLGLLNLYMPFTADQVAVMIGAKTLSAGGQLYVDFWDNKMPALYWFYQLAGESFGYTEAGIHAFDLVWMTVFSVVLVTTLRSVFDWKVLPAVAPVAVVGTYYASVEFVQLTQLEMLVGFPIFVCAWSASKVVATESRDRAFALASGVFAGITVSFKLLFAPVAVAFWIVASFRLLRDGTSARQVLTTVWLPVSIGTVAVLGIIVWLFWRNGALDELLWTAFVYPPQALELAAPAPWFRRIASTLFYLAYFVPWAIPIGIALWRWCKRDADTFTTMMAWWLVIGLCLIAVQRFSWWTYHFLFIFTPSALLALRGVDYLRGDLRSKDVQHAGMVVATVLIMGISTLTIPITQKLQAHIEILFNREGKPSDLMTVLNADYPEIYQSTRFLRDRKARKGPIYVMGDPLYYHLSGRQPALPMIGWPWAYFLQSQWYALPAQLKEAKPAYLFVDKLNQKFLESRGGGVKEFIGQHYTALFRDPHGHWYAAKPRSWDD